LADERERVLDLALRVVRPAEHERELGDDAVLARARRDLERLRRRQLLVHAPQHLVGPGLGAEEDHAQPGARDPAPRRVLEAEQRVDARLAPPREAERLDALAPLER